jgi:hypothetical protein
MKIIWVTSSSIKVKKGGENICAAEKVVNARAAIAALVNVN